MKLLFLDIYKKSPSRISKDTAGGYFGKFYLKLLKLNFLAKFVFYSINGEFDFRGHQ